MPKFLCPNCKAKLSAPSKLAGVAGKCPKCGAATTVPSLAPTPPPKVRSSNLPIMLSAGFVGLMVIAAGLAALFRPPVRPGQPVSRPLNYTTVSRKVEGGSAELKILWPLASLPDRATVEAELLRQYAELRAEAEATKGPLGFMKVLLWLDCDARDYKLGGGPRVCMMFANNARDDGTFGSLPDLPQTIEWHWRDKATMPSERDRDICYDFMQLAWERNKQIEAKYSPLTRENMVAYSKEDDESDEKTRKDICEKYGITRDEYERLMYHVIWWSQGQVLTPEKLDEAMKLKNE